MLFSSNKCDNYMLDKHDYVSSEIVEEIQFEFMENVTRIFHKNLAFAFIFGGFGKGYATKTHDIDMFICLLREASLECISEFRAWYFALHAKYHLPPDFKYPGEVVTLQRLTEKVLFLQKRCFRQVVETYYEYEAIIWCDALSERKIGLIVNDYTYYTLKEIADTTFSSWRSQIYRDWLYSEPIEELEKLDLRRLFKKAGIRYMHKTNTLEKNI